MGIKPLEKDDKTLVLRVVLILGLIITGFFLNKFYLKKTKTYSRKPPQKKEILGENVVKNIEKSLPKNIDATVKKIEEATSNVLGEVTDLVTDTASKSAGAVSDFVFENTVGNLLKQIEKLPQKQQEEIKERICK